MQKFKYIYLLLLLFIILPPSHSSAEKLNIADDFHSSSISTNELNEQLNSKEGSITNIPEKFEAEVGSKYAEIIEEKWPVDPIYTDKINKTIVPRLLNPLSTSSYPYVIKVLKKPSTNAFCIPNGHIYITENLVNFVELDDELFFVLAHEIGHQEKNHFMNGITTLMLNDNISLDNASLSVINNGYNFNKENEADHYAFDMLVKSNYNLGAGALFFYRSIINNSDHLSSTKVNHPESIDRIKKQLYFLEEYSNNKFSIIYKGEKSTITLKDQQPFELSTSNALLVAGILAREYHKN